MNGNKTDGHEGRVEFCFKGRWGAVCDESWDYQDAEVVCRQLGFGTMGTHNSQSKTIYQTLIHPIGAAAFTGSHYGPGKGPVYLTRVGCTGSESNLTDCSHSLFGDVLSMCKTHFSDASVQCPAGM